MPALIDWMTETELYTYIRGVVDRTYGSLPTQDGAAARDTTLPGHGTPRVKLDRRSAADRRNT